MLLLAVPAVHRTQKPRQVTLDGTPVMCPIENQCSYLISSYFGLKYPKSSIDHRKQGILAVQSVIPSDESFEPISAEDLPSLPQMTPLKIARNKSRNLESIRFCISNISLLDLSIENPDSVVAKGNVFFINKRNCTSTLIAYNKLLFNLIG